MNMRRTVCSTLLLLVCVGSSGCVIVSGGWGGCRSTVWVEAEQNVTVGIDGLQTLDVQTHNGRVTYAGANNSTQVTAQVHLKGGARSMEEAQNALDAIEVFVEPGKQGRQLLGWRWNPKKRHSWRGQVSFEMTGPAELNLEVETHNGRIEVSGVQGSVTTVTHNGRIIVSAAQGKLYAKTHNGRIEADYDGEDVTLVTHNGSISARLNKCQEIQGKMVTHNGSVKVTLGDRASTFVDAQTYNGRISCDLPIDVKNRSRRHLSGTLGNGGGRLNLTTHNGGINIQ